MTTHRYFTIMIGLRGCYMPDRSYTVAAQTRRELKSHIFDEARPLRETGTFDKQICGLSDKLIAWAAAHAWRGEKHSTILPYGERGSHGLRVNKLYSIEIVPATRKDYLESQAHA